jgi:hypothetical protein
VDAISQCLTHAPPEPEPEGRSATPPSFETTCSGLEPGKNTRTTKNVTGNEIQFLGHFPCTP